MHFNTIVNSNPKDRILINGASSLNDVELISLLIGHCHSDKAANAVAEGLLNLTGGDVYALGKFLPEGFEQVNGVGKEMSLVLSAAIELGRRRSYKSSVKSIVIASSKDVFNRFTDRLSD
jgi:DNA repair protein RadC